MSTQDNWYIERFEPTGSAIGYRVEAKLDEVQSPFQKIEIYRTSDWGNLMLIDGAVMLTSRDNFLYHEMMSHPALFTHADPKQVVIIGGGDCGTLREVLKHPGVESGAGSMQRTIIVHTQIVTQPNHMRRHRCHLMTIAQTQDVRIRRKITL